MVLPSFDYAIAIMQAVPSLRSASVQQPGSKTERGIYSLMLYCQVFRTSTAAIITLESQTLIYGMESRYEFRFKNEMGFDAMALQICASMCF
jgi:hypothetical protein